ncbi:MAG TPA: hypothetical protein VFW33_17285 [Gemmataceae bacterium]|nr:hypothetical protein [Gemmataceae bacterium]
MQLTSKRSGTEQGGEATNPAGPPRCPVCSGPLVELRATLRCSRCYFSMCEGCSGEPPDDFAGAGE